jgi:hypothetical protein
MEWCICSQEIISTGSGNLTTNNIYLYDSSSTEHNIMLVDNWTASQNGKLIVKYNPLKFCFEGTVEMPGAASATVTVDRVNNAITVTATSDYKNYSIAIPIPKEMNNNSVSLVLKNGLLTITGFKYTTEEQKLLVETFTI